MGEYPPRSDTGYGTREAQQHAEGRLARTLERETAKLPSDVWLWSAVGAIGTAAALQMFGRRQASLFVGQWVAPLLLIGVYNKIVKTQGSDRVTG
jgi:hypothetical protein